MDVRIASSPEFHSNINLEMRGYSNLIRQVARVVDTEIRNAFLITFQIPLLKKKNYLPVDVRVSMFSAP